MSDGDAPASAGGHRTTVAPAVDDRFAVPLRGVGVDAVTRCAHYDGARDRIAIRFPCCDAYYPCFRCHDDAAGHPAERWPRDRFGEAAVLCGGCGARLSVRRYLDADDACPDCGLGFNPGCAAHRDRYFAVERSPPDGEGEQGFRNC